DSVQYLPFSLGLRADSALLAGDSVAAERLILTSLKLTVLNTPVAYRWLLASFYARRGQTAAALKLARAITLPSVLQEDNTTLVPAALLLQGQLEEQLGHTKEAVAVYERFVELRADADSARRPEVGRIHLRLAELAV